MQHVIVVINTRDLLDCVIAQIEFFLRCPNVKIVLCDNASTYPPLLDFYYQWYGFEGHPARSQEVVTSAARGHGLGNVDAFFFPENRGPRGQQSIFHRLWTMYEFDYYFLSEPDLDFTDVDPERLFPDLIAGFETYPTIQGIGVSLRIDDLPDIPIRDTVLLHESHNWETHPTYYDFGGDNAPVIDGRFYVGGTDTAGVLRRVKPSWDGGYEGLRSTIHIARHLPWYHVDQMWMCKQCGRPVSPGLPLCSCRTAVVRPDDFQWYLDHADPRGTVYTSKVLDKGYNRLR